MSSTQPSVLFEAALARRLNMHRQTLARLRESGKLDGTFFRFNKRVRYNVAAVTARLSELEDT